jgi:hypothetical protein
LGETEDASEHQQAWDFLKTALDEDRLALLNQGMNQEGIGTSQNLR